MNTWIKNGMGLAVVAAVAFGTDWAVRHYHRPGQLDVISAQAMDMSQMRPPTGAAPVALASVREGSLAETVTYTGTVRAYNEQEISPRITGRLVSLPFYPGDPVRAGQVVARLDAVEVGAQADQAASQAREAQIGAQVAHLTHHLHHWAALEQAQAQVGAAAQGVTDAQAEALADQDAISDAQAGVQSAQAGADYWKTEIAREKRLADAGAVSQQEYQSELSQSQAADALLLQSQAKVRQAQATAAAARAKVAEAHRQVDVAQAGVRMAQADLVVAEGQAAQAGAGASAAQAAARQAAVVAGYARIVSPAAGVITARPVAPGTLVQPGTVILRVAEIDRVRVQANVAVQDLAGVRVGSAVTVSVQGDGGGRTISARVSSVFPAASDQTRTAVVEAVLPNPNHRLLPGEFVTMGIARNAVSGKLLVPSAAVISEGGVSSVWTVGGPSTAPTGALTARRLAVRVGAGDGVWTEVSSDRLTPGTQVVTHGQAGLTDGARVVATAWGADGPMSLPSAAAAKGDQTVYRCEKCGMTYSAADAKRNHFIDPMDGGRLIPVRGN